VCWKRFIAENNIWKKKEDLENTRESVDKFEGRIEAKVRWQEGLDKVWKVKLNQNIEEFKRSKLPEKYTTRILFG